MAIALGANPKVLEKAKNYYKIKTIFPANGVVKEVEDGDTFVLDNNIKVRMLGINSPDRGSVNYLKSKEKLTQIINNKKVYLEYDRYQDDKYGRILAWVWVNCESTPKFLPADYMHKSGNESSLGLTHNPEGCKKGKLVQEEMVDLGFSEVVTYKDRGELKYEMRLKNLNN